MSVESVRNFFKQHNAEHLVLHSETISDTVENAANVLGCKPQEIAKTMSFLVGDQPILIVASGDAKIDNPKYKGIFHTKAKMIPFNEVEAYTGHLPGGICPFGLKEGVKVFLDVSLKRFAIVYTGGGDEHNTVKVTIPELESYSGYESWIDVCKDWQIDLS